MPDEKTGAWLLAPVLLGVTLWAPLGTPAVSSPPQDDDRRSPTERPALDLPAWLKLSWAQNAPKPTAPAARAAPVRVLSVLRRQGQPTAVIDRGTGTPTMYLPLGATNEGITFRSMDGTRVLLQVNGEDLNVELGR